MIPLKRSIVLPKLKSFSVVKDLKEKAEIAVAKMNDSRYALWLVHIATGRNNLVIGDPAKYWQALQFILEDEAR